MVRVLSARRTVGPNDVPVSSVGITLALLLLSGPSPTQAQASTIYLPGSSGSGPYQCLKDWIAAFESRYAESDFSVSSVGSGAAQSALWGEIDCKKKPVEGICDDVPQEEDGSGAAAAAETGAGVSGGRPRPTETVWGMGGGTIGSDAYAIHSPRGLQQLPALGGPVLVTYSKDVTGDLGSQTSSQLNLSMDTVAGIFNNTILRWNHPKIREDNPGIELPNERITVIVRSDKSGMSETFTEALRHAVPGWPEGGVGKTPTWPLANLTHSADSSTSRLTAAACAELTAAAAASASGGAGNASTAAAASSAGPNGGIAPAEPLNFKADGQTGIGIGLLRRPYSVGYLEPGYHSTLTQFVSQAYLSSPAHPADYQAATVSTVRTTMNGLVDELEPETLSLTLVDNPTPGGGYPISRYVYWYVKTSPDEYDSCYQAWLLYRFIEWTFTDPLAEEIALEHGWITIPESVASRALEKLNEVKCYLEEEGGGGGRDDGSTTRRAVPVSTYVPPPYRPRGASDGGSSVATVIAAIVVPVVVLAAILAYVYVERRKRSVDSVWAVRPDELKFDDPPEIVGRGTFGLVLLAEYRGTQVAVKRVIPPKFEFQTSKVGNSSGKASGDGNASTASNGSFRRSMLGDGDKIAERRLSVCFEVAEEVAEQEDDLENGSQKSSELGPAEEQAGLKSGKYEVARRMSGGRQARRLSEGHLSGGYDAGKPNGGYEAGKLSGGTSSGSLQLKSRSGTLSGASTLMSLKKRLGIGKSEALRDYEKLKSDFIIEMRYLSKLRHPCITTVMGAIVDKREEPMLVMEYMSKGSLYDLLHNETVPLDGNVLLPILQDICQGLRFLHAADPQVIHGDLKAQNILVDSKFRAKVADFGLSQKKEIGATGTPFWMAPELLRGESENTAASDIYSFGIILYEVYSRRDPYEGEDFLKVIRDVCDPWKNKRPPVPKGCPPTVASLMEECLEADKYVRPTFEELDLRLKRFSVDNVEPDDAARKEKMERELGNAEELLYDMFPRHIADALKEGKKVEPEHHECVTIFFSDIVGFTTLSEAIGALGVTNMLHRLYTRFDELANKHDVFKIETIGDAYLATSNLIKNQNEDHVKRMAEFAIDAVKAASEVMVDESNSSLGYVEIRVGFHTGPIITDVIGTRLPKFGMFGDSVNVASRMESNSKPGAIHCSLSSAKLLGEQAPGIELVSRGNIHIKGKGEMHTFWVKEGSAGTTR